MSRGERSGGGTDGGDVALLTRLNEDHAEQVLYCVRAFTPRRDAERAEVLGLRPEGLEVLCAGERHVIPLAPAASLQAAFEATALDAMKRLGVWPPRRVAHWTLTQNSRVGAHFRRLTFDLGGDDRSDWRPGDSCRFDVADGDTPRPYTLRRLEGWRDQLDVFCHEQTPGTLWATGLSPGMQVTVRGERHELLPDFTRGATWLLGDETALPTIAALLEGWRESGPLRALLKLRDLRDRAYLDGVAWPETVQVQWVDDLVAAAQAQDGTPAAVWAASEVGEALALGKTLRSRFPTAEVRIIGYWRRASPA